MGLVIRLLELMLVLVPLIGAVYAAFRGFTALRGRQSGPVAQPAEITQAGDPTAAQRRVIRRAIEEHDRTDTRWLEYELDVAKVLDCPMMTDLRDPLTERFHRAKLRVDFLRPADVADLVDDRDATRDYLGAVQEYVTAFDIAEAEALRRRRSGFTGEEQQRLARAQRLLRTAADSAATQQERERAYRLARRELDGLLVLPERARAALERGISGELG
ncbi:hypothetical protein C6A87_027525 [Mycobacterium sp. ITM-2016-00317]|uniref:hypothetical protein n=1 Tax=Mycobacterium sp. ITM-2016-00317 TaxID=2099694 RepID=UPI000D4CF852|nr:hypothetical protein [Mycobacterium sp. ITM-2016-00317]WNG87444.1 hypothetical protein C6A87_027525 [Mycobacterium sp. ITM-2016-00317]